MGQTGGQNFALCPTLSRLCNKKSPLGKNPSFQKVITPAIVAQFSPANPHTSPLACVCVCVCVCVYGGGLRFKTNDCGIIMIPRANHYGSYLSPPPVYELPCFDSYFLIIDSEHP